MGIGARKPIELIMFAVSKTTAGNWVTDENKGVSFKTWAEITNSGSSRNYAQQTQLEKTKRFLVRFRFDKYPNADWKIRYNGQDYTVSDIDKVDEKKFYWSILASCSGSK